MNEQDTEYEEEKPRVHLTGIIKGQQVVFCKGSLFFSDVIKTNNPSECTCKMCFYAFKKECARIANLNRMRAALGWEKLDTSIQLAKQQL